MKKLKKKFIKLDESTRLYRYDKPIMAITGGIATGKSTVTKMLQTEGLKIIDADQLVKSIYKTKEAQDFIAKNYPMALSNSDIDFPKLRHLFFHDQKIKEEVEKFIYARLPHAFKQKAQEIQGQSFYIYDVPLLFERGLDQLVDLAVTVYSPSHIQTARLMGRDGHVEEMAKRILSHQMDIEEKKIKADFVIDNSGTLEELAAEVRQFLQQVLE